MDQEHSNMKGSAINRRIDETEPVGEITKQLGNVSEAIEGLHSVIDFLESRLGSIMAPEIAQEKEDAGENKIAPRNPVSSMASGLQFDVVRIGTAIARINRIIDRMEL